MKRKVRRKAERRKSGRSGRMKVVDDHVMKSPSKRPFPMNLELDREGWLAKWAEWRHTANPVDGREEIISGQLACSAFEDRSQKEVESREGSVQDGIGGWRGRRVSE
jgi:hypothetical protein